MLLAPTGFLCGKVRIRFFNALMPPKLTYWAILLCFDWAVTLRRWKAHFHFCLDGEAATKKGHCGHCGLIEGSTSLVNCDQTNWLIVLRCKASLSKQRLALMRQFFLSFSFHALGTPGNNRCHTDNPIIVKLVNLVKSLCSTTRPVSKSWVKQQKMASLTLPTHSNVKSSCWIQKK